jgi:glutamyl-tRNA reductase
MTNEISNKLSHFSVAGINYRKSDVNIRGKFSLSGDQCGHVISQSFQKNISGVFVLSTCNRTEVYGLCGDPGELIELLCLHTQGTVQDFLEHGYVLQGLDAVDHLFNVSAGLDSQIVGDYEILAQLKHAVNFARERGSINGFVERIVNYALQASKDIKTKTNLSSGTVSVSYATIEIIKEKIENIADKKILLIGTGKFGNHIAKNLKNYFPGTKLSISNRTNDKACALAGLCDAVHIPYEALQPAVLEHDIIIVSSAAENYVITPSFFTNDMPRLLLDLSIPQNVDPEVGKMPGVHLMNVDEISAILDKTIGRRKAEIPKALGIIDDTINELKSWYGMQANAPVLRKIKTHLHQLSKEDSAESTDKIHKAVSSLAIQLKQKNNKGCQYIHAMSDYLHRN